MRFRKLQSRFPRCVVIVQDCAVSIGALLQSFLAEVTQSLHARQPKYDALRSKFRKQAEGTATTVP